MIRLYNKRAGLIALALTVALAILLTPTPRIDAADHADAPIFASDQAADIADAYFFLDPNDNSRVVIIGTFHGFIVPNEQVNFGVFDENIRHRFEIENTGDARPDLFIDTFFTPQRTTPAQPQIATVVLSSGQTFTAPRTIAALTPTPPPIVVTRDQATGIDFFAAVTDDPFFFDIPGFNRFVASVLAGAPRVDATTLMRGRDSFAGFNILSIAFSIPANLLRGSSGNEIGLNFVIQRRSSQNVTKRGTVIGSGRWVNVDRIATPAVNVALVPFRRKHEFNASTPQDDANGRFADDIVATLRALGTDATSIGVLANVAVARGDFLRLNLSITNSGPGGGNNPEAAFPNGRRLGDDVIDTILFLVANRQTLGDNVNGNEVPRRDTFPFLAPSHQPAAPGTVDDRTRN